MNEIIVYDDIKESAEDGTQRYIHEIVPPLQPRAILCLEDVTDPVVYQSKVVLLHTNIPPANKDRSVLLEFVKQIQDVNSSIKFAFFSGASIPQHLITDLKQAIPNHENRAIFLYRSDLIAHFKEFCDTCFEEGFVSEKIDLSILQHGGKGKVFELCYNILSPFLPLHVLLQLSEEDRRVFVNLEEWQRQYLVSLKEVFYSSAQQCEDLGRIGTIKDTISYKELQRAFSQGSALKDICDFFTKGEIAAVPTNYKVIMVEIKKIADHIRDLLNH